MGRSRYHVLGTQPHFLTCTVINWIPLFGKVEFTQIILDSLNFLHRQQPLTLYGYVDDPTHWRYSSYRNYMGELGLLKVELIDL